MPIALPMLSRGTIRYTRGSVTTGSTPPGMAWMIRKTISLSRFQARPHSADAMQNSTRQAMYALVSPTRSPTQALSGTITPRASV